VAIHFIPVDELQVKSNLNEIYSDIYCKERKYGAFSINTTHGNIWIQRKNI